MTGALRSIPCHSDEELQQLGLPDDHPAVTYFDWDYWTRDLFIQGFRSVDAGLSEGVYVFSDY